MDARSVLRRIVHHRGMPHGILLRLVPLLLRPGLYVVLYHHVGERTAAQGDRVTTSAARFAEHIEYFRKRLDIVSVATGIRTFHSAPQKARLAVTFDDGFKSFLTAALPILEKYCVPATLFVNPAVMDGNSIAWRHAVTSLRSQERDNELKSAIRGAYPPDHPGLADLDTEDIITWTKQHFLYPHMDRAIDRVLTPEDRAAGSALYMTWSDVEDALTRGNGLLEIGNHTLHHYVLSKLPRTVQAMEIEGASEQLETRLGLRPSQFAYPFGGVEHFDGTTREEVRRLRLTALSAYGGHNSVLDPTDVKRICLTDETPRQAMLKLLDSTADPPASPEARRG